MLQKMKHTFFVKYIHMQNLPSYQIILLGLTMLISYRVPTILVFFFCPFIQETKSQHTTEGKYNYVIMVMSPSWDIWLFMTTQRILSSLVLTVITTRGIHCLSISRAFWSIINYCSKSIDLSISFRCLSSDTPSTSSRNWGSRRGYLAFILGIIYIIGMTSKYTFLCTSIIRLDSLLQIGHTGTKLAFGLMNCTWFFHSG